MEDYAIIIGVEHYKDSNLQQLEGATNDASDFYGWITDPNGGNIIEANCKLLLSDEGLSKVFLNHIEDETSDILEKAKKNRQNARRLYFYFSGHGLGVSLDEVALLPTNWVQLLANRAVASKEYHDAIVEFGIFEEVFFFLDCCRSRKVNIRPQGAALYSPGTDTNAKNTQSLIVFSAQHWDSAYEENIEDEHGKRRNGFFTKALLNGLRGEAASGNGEITIDLLKGHLISEVPEIAKQFNKNQQPRFLDTFQDKETIITSVSLPVYEAGEINICIQFSDDTTGPYQIIDKNTNSIGPWNKENGEWKLNLEFGIHLLRDQGTDKVLPLEIERNLKEIKNVKF